MNHQIEYVGDALIIEYVKQEIIKMKNKIIVSILICMIFILVFIYNPFITIRYFEGCSMYPDIKYNSIDLIMSTDFIGYKMNDVVIYDGVAGDNIEHKIVGTCGKNNESYYIAGTDFVSEGDIVKLTEEPIHISIKECVNKKYIHHKRIGGIDWMGKRVC